MAETERARIGDRSLFPQLGCAAYLGHAAISPVNLLSARNVERLLQDYAERGQQAYLTWFEQRERVRGMLASLIGASTAEVALLGGTSHALSCLAFSIDWRPGERVVLLSGEFPANVAPWLRAAERFGLEPRFVSLADAHQSDDSFLVPLEEELAAGARLVAVSAVQFQTGLRMPLDEISRLCARYGVELAVDGIQALGVVPLSVAELQVDYLAGGAHKWLLGMEGAGFLYVREERQGRLRPQSAGWLSHEDGTRFLFQADQLRYDLPLRSEARVFESGSTHNLGFAALEGGLAILEQVGVGQIFEHVTAYLDRLEPILERLGFVSRRAARSERRSGILSAVPPAGHTAGQLVTGLGEHGIVASSPDGLLRFAPHYANALDEVELVARALERCVTSSPPRPA